MPMKILIGRLCNCRDEVLKQLYGNCGSEYLHGCSDGFDCIIQEVVDYYLQLINETADEE